MFTDSRAVIVLLRVALAGAFLALIPFEFFSLPGQFAHMAATDPSAAPLRWPLTALTIFWVVCAQVVIFCTWQLLTLVQKDRIFSEVSLRWVDGILWTILAAWTTMTIFSLVVAFRADDPGPVVLLFFFMAGVTIAGLLMVVMRALLRQATTLRSDMEAVI